MNKLTLLRPVVAVIVIPALIPAVVLVGMLMAWWELIGLGLRLLPERWSMRVGRVVGAMPFTWWLVATLMLAALAAWAIRGREVMATHRALCENSIEQLENIPRLREIGGFW